MLRRGQYRAIEGEYYGTPKEIWSFRYETRGRTPVERARHFLLEHRELFGLEPGLESIEHDGTRVGLASTHVIFAQRLHGYRVRRGWISVHLDPGGRAYLTKSRILPRKFWPSPEDAELGSKRVAAGRAKRALAKGVTHFDAHPMWFPDKDLVIPVYRVRLRRLHPREWWRVYVHARDDKILHKYDNASNARKRGLVFDPNPVVALGDHATLLGPGGRPRQPGPECYREVTLLGLGKSGHLEGKYVTTELTNAKRRIKAKNGDFRVHSHEKGFDEVMAYYHVDRAMRHLEKMGYRGRKALFDRPLLVDANGTREDNAAYDPATKSLLFGTGGIDEAEDGETILHEFGHAIQDAICPEFGQSAEAAAMGEGFGDYFAAGFFEESKGVRYRPTVMSWDGLLYGLDAGFDPPCVRRLDGELSYADFKPRGDEHDNGEIWAATLWDLKAKLGRERADKIIIESHFQLDPFTTFARGARAILNANEHLYDGEQARTIQNVFKARGIELKEA